MFEFLWNHIPWYIPVIIGVIVAGLCWQWIAPIYIMLPNWMRWTIGAIGMLFVAVQYGRNRGVAGEQQRRKTLNEHAIATRDNIDEKIKNMPDNAVTTRLRANGWLRDD